MALYNLMWRAIELGKAKGLTKFDMWGSPGPNPSPKDPWAGFHRFKEGFGATLEEYLGTFDLIIDQPKYKLFTLADNWRWKYLRLRKLLPF
jgi:lipid II:glycine glycyltransferase (peptidoglycan interpeptide bridge formation enzyme)